MARHDKIKLEIKRARALDLRIKGLSYQQIADEMGYKSKTQAYNLVSTAIAKSVKEKREELFALSVLSLEKLNKIYQEQDIKDIKVADMILKIHDRTVKLLDLLPKDKIEITHKRDIDISWDGQGELEDTPVIDESEESEEETQ
jgi:hypothetical protein